jgi:hypothetical protein
MFFLFRLSGTAAAELKRFLSFIAPEARPSQLKDGAALRWQKRGGRLDVGYS